MQVLTEKAYAKINLGLKVLNRRPDGFHDILSVFQTVDLSDALVFEPGDAGELEVACESDEIPPGPGNLVYRAVQALRDARPLRNGPGVRILLRKQIPVGAGLGGGSSDAATVLRVLNREWELELSHAELWEIALGLGSDVGFFLRDGTAIVSGRGDEVRYAAWDGDYAYLLVHPGFQVSTRWAYESLRIRLTRDSRYVTFLDSVGRGSKLHPAALLNCLENDFLSLVASTHPEVRELLDMLASAGALAGSLSGSGSTLYGVFDAVPRAEEAAGYLNAAGYRITLCRAVPGNRSG